MQMRNSNIAWIGDIPHNWKVRRLKMSVDIASDKVDYNGENYVGLENIEPNGGRYIEVENQHIEGVSTTFSVGDVLFGKLRPYLVKCIIAEFEGVCSSELLVLRDYQGDKRFLRYSLIAPNTIDIITSSTYGTKMPRASWNFIGNMSFPLPPLETQQKIANFLDSKCDKIDSTIEREKEHIEKLKEYRQSLITEAVTKGLNPNTPMKDSGIEWIGEIPRGWEICRLKNYAVICNGHDYKDVYDENGTYPVMGSGGKFSSASTFMYDKESVLLGRKGTVDKPLFVDFPFWTVDTMYYTKISPIALPKYFYYLCTTIDFQYYQYGSAVPSMTQRDLNSVEFPLPTLFEQKEIADYLDKKTAQIDKAIAKKESLIEKLQEYKKSLIFEAVTGKLEV